MILVESQLLRILDFETVMALQKKIFLLLTFSFLLNFNAFSQTYSCGEIADLVEREGFKWGSLDSYKLKSSWLRSAVCYKYDGILFVIAEMKDDDLSNSYRRYIFCGIPEDNWLRFENAIFDPGYTRGQLFHRYIIDYGCNCE